MNDNDKQPGPDSGGPNPWMKSLLVWVGVLVALALFVTMIDTRSTPAAGGAIAYSTFLDKVQEGTVKEVNVAGDVISGTLRDDTRFRTYAMADPQLTDKLRAKNVVITAKPEEGPAIWQVILIQSLPFLLFLGIAFFVLRQMQKNSGSGAMGFGKSRAKMLTQKEGRVTFDDVAGIDEAREELQEIVEFLKDPTKFARLGGKIPKGALLVGSPGTGKTLLARAIAGEAGVPFFTISGSDFVEMFVGVGASRVRDMFEQAKKSAPCIVFIDEIDAVGRHRGAGLGNGNDEREQTLNQLLVEMDGFEASEGIIIVAATNRPDVLDPALLRPGRFDRRVTVPLPDIEGRVKILEVHMKKVPLAPDVDARTLARGTPGMSGADLANLVNEAALMAARLGKRLVAMAQFEIAKDRVIMGTEWKSLVMTPDEKRMTAYHEAGHALVRVHELASDPIHKATIIPRGGALGMVVSMPERDNYSYHRDKMYADLASVMGGRVAEEVIFGHDKVSSGASSDIKQATKLARAMVTQWGMSEAIGPLQYEEQQGETFLGYSQTQRHNMSNETALAIDGEIRRLVEGGHARATELITKHVDQLHAIAGALLEFETLTGEEIKALVAGNAIDRDSGPKAPSVPVGGTSIPKTRRPKGPFGNPAPAGA
ncbi:ATP-dependent metallopeptidase FtsH/Yme1/Tma family protein [Sphingomonas sp. So64.6b]|uniref:ATP-dependent zinc metalloprotease FtsH n=1 Tax=Sphingomonas sp. So64.6b TaxID=2997354 RepID=UPI0016010B7F|nr:ATP-dependent zinc metalloprotease FtsH [Sphingomonas sp. So64.6b]QNA85614.1 ATP-dependent metallopeptidase FtsH/Yme1/Tma family protein [Sphingomonas sp. So64.6b]